MTEYASDCENIRIKQSKNMLTNGKESVSDGKNVHKKKKSKRTKQNYKRL